MPIIEVKNKGFGATVGLKDVNITSTDAAKLSVTKEGAGTDTLTFSLTPTIGGQVDSVTITSADSNKLKVTAGGTGDKPTFKLDNLVKPGGQVDTVTIGSSDETKLTVTVGGIPSNPAFTLNPIGSGGGGQVNSVTLTSSDSSVSITNNADTTVANPSFDLKVIGGGGGGGGGGGAWGSITGDITTQIDLQMALDLKESTYVIYNENSLINAYSQESIPRIIVPNTTIKSNLTGNQSWSFKTGAPNNVLVTCKSNPQTNKVSFTITEYDTSKEIYVISEGEWITESKYHIYDDNNNKAIITLIPPYKLTGTTNAELMRADTLAKGMIIQEEKEKIGIMDLINMMPRQITNMIVWASPLSSDNQPNNYILTGKMCTINATLTIPSAISGSDVILGQIQPPYNVFNTTAERFVSCIGMYIYTSNKKIETQLVDIDIISSNTTQFIPYALVARNVAFGLPGELRFQISWLSGKD